MAQRELKRIARLQPSSTEWAVSRNYLELVADLPWNIRTPDVVDVIRAKRQLDQDHFGYVSSYLPGSETKVTHLFQPTPCQKEDY